MSGSSPAKEKYRYDTRLEDDDISAQFSDQDSESLASEPREGTELQQSTASSRVRTASIDNTALSSEELLEDISNLNSEDEADFGIGPISNGRVGQSVVGISENGRVSEGRQREISAQGKSKDISNDTVDYLREKVAKISAHMNPAQGLSMQQMSPLQRPGAYPIGTRATGQSPSWSPARAQRQTPESNRRAPTNIPPELQPPIYQGSENGEQQTENETNVESNPNICDFPPEGPKDNATSKPFHKRRYFFVIVAGVCCVALGIILALALRGDDEKDSPDEKVTDGPNDRYPERLSQVEMNLVEELEQLEGIVDISVLDDPSSTQSLAVSWLANEDTFKGPSELVARYTIVNFYYAMSETPWMNNLNFLNPETSVCNWNLDGQGVFCDENSKVTTLQIDQLNDLKGSIPEETVLLSSLTEFRLANQKKVLGDNVLQTIQGSMVLGDITSLQILDLSGNQLVGEVPRRFAQLVDLEELYLNDNAFQDELSRDFEDLVNLKVLHLHNNRLEGSAEVGISAMKNLEELRLDGNDVGPSSGLQVQSSVWSTLTNLRDWRMDGVTISSDFVRPLNGLVQQSNLRILHWNNGALQGELIGLEQLSNLQSLKLANNFLTGIIPWEALSPEMTTLDLGGNSFVGPLDGIDQLSNLVSLDLSFNAFSGSLPVTLEGSWNDLLELNLQGNPLLTGSLDPLCDRLEEPADSPSPSMELVFRVECEAILCKCCEC